MKRFIILILTALLLCTSCMTMALIATEAGKDNINSERPYLHLHIIQTIDKGFALATTNQYDPVALFSTVETFYDGKTYTDYYQLVDTYIYEDLKGRVRTVPVYMFSSEYRKVGYSKRALDLYRL